MAQDTIDACVKRKVEVGVLEPFEETHEFMLITLNRKDGSLNLTKEEFVLSKECTENLWSSPHEAGDPHRSNLLRKELASILTKRKAKDLRKGGEEEEPRIALQALAVSFDELSSANPSYLEAKTLSSHDLDEFINNSKQLMEDLSVFYDPIISRLKLLKAHNTEGADPELELFLQIVREEQR